MKNRISLGISLLFAMATNVMGQTLTTESDIIDCGLIQFRTPKTIEVKLKNPSSKQVTIREIRNGCGCTKTKVSKKNIGSRKTTTLKIEYDAKQLGHFTRHIEVYTKHDDVPLIIQLQGVVVTEIKDYSTTYPYEIGQIRTDKDVVEFDDVCRGEKPVQTINILNTTGTAIEPVVMHLPEYILAEVSPVRIMPEEGGEIRLTLLTEKLRDLGLSQTSIYLGKNMGEKVSAEKEIPVSAVLLPSVEGNANKETLPEIILSAKEIKVSNMAGKKGKKKGEITIQNTGKGMLEISSLQMFTSGMQVSLAKRNLKPMEATTLKINVDEEELRQQKTRPRILMITNDPKNPKVVIEVK